MGAKEGLLTLHEGKGYAGVADHGMDAWLRAESYGIAIQIGRREISSDQGSRPGRPYKE